MCDNCETIPEWVEKEEIEPKWPISVELVI